MNYNVKIKKLSEKAIIPTYGSPYSAGADLYSAMDDITIEPHTTTLVKTGIALEIPVGFAGLIYARSGLATKKGLAPANKVGVCDSDYRGEYIVPLHNHGKEAVEVLPNQRIAQLIITSFIVADFMETDSLSETQRDAGGFGSTGK
jgi:dUTP pyrophosphatase